MACERQGQAMKLIAGSRSASSDDEAPDIDPAIRCSRCEATCCRLTVHVMSDDPTPDYFIDQDEYGMDVMRRLDDGWCTALDRATMRCTIYSMRPLVCRDFDMGGRDCREVRADERGLAITVVQGIADP